MSIDHSGKTTNFSVPYRLGTWSLIRGCTQMKLEVGHNFLIFIFQNCQIPIHNHQKKKKENPMEINIKLQKPGMSQTGIVRKRSIVGNIGILYKAWARS